MIPIILEKRRSKVRSGRAFNQLVSYVEGHTKQEQQHAVSPHQKFENILNYTTSHEGVSTGTEKCIAIRIHGVTDISSATLEMNAVSARNTRCKDPAFHFVLAWPEHEHPPHDLIFEAAEHVIKSLGLGEHQYVLAIHVDTDNIHCHGAVNRINPNTYKSQNIEWANRTMHLAARECEIKHGWTHDNGIYIVEIDVQNNKSIILNPVHDHTIPHTQREQEHSLPTWHDPDSLDSWLKSKVAKSLKRDLPKLTDWNALHIWLNRYEINLTDSGGGGMRLTASSPETGETLDIPASRGLRILKRAELEKRWGKFVPRIFAKSLPCVVPDLSHLTRKQLAKGVNAYLKQGFDRGVPPDHIRRANPISVDHNEKRDNSKKEERRNLRAAERADLRQRFSQYKQFARVCDIDHIKRLKEIRADRSNALKEIRKKTAVEKAILKKNRTLALPAKFVANIALDAFSLRQKNQAEAIFQEKSQSLRIARIPALSWRVWLFEQANLGDQAAISALRGIIYQAQRDAKHKEKESGEEEEAKTADAQERQYRKVMARLLEEEKQEVAIRSAHSTAMRPHEVDSLLVRYAGIQWHVTGNGNIEYSQDGGHLFTDRGNRITFDRVCVSDGEIHLALIHAKQKFGNQLTLTGNDPDFTVRMARLADEMGMTVLNPELQLVIANHRASRELQITLAPQEPTPQEIAILNESIINPAPAEPLLQKPGESGEKILLQPETPAPVQTLAQVAQDSLRIKVLSVDPHAIFVIPDPADNQTLYVGPVAAIQDDAQGYAQHIGRGLYAIHPTPVPENHNNTNIEIRYQNGHAITTVSDRQKGKGRND